MQEVMTETHRVLYPPWADPEWIGLNSPPRIAQTNPILPNWQLSPLSANHNRRERTQSCQNGSPRSVSSRVEAGRTNRTTANLPQVRRRSRTEIDDDRRQGMVDFPATEADKRSHWQSERDLPILPREGSCVTLAIKTKPISARVKFIDCTNEADYRADDGDRHRTSRDTSRVGGSSKDGTYGEAPAPSRRARLRSEAVFRRLTLC